MMIYGVLPILSWMIMISRWMYMMSRFFQIKLTRSYISMYMNCSHHCRDVKSSIKMKVS